MSPSVCAGTVREVEGVSLMEADTETRGTSCGGCGGKGSGGC